MLIKVRHTFLETTIFWNCSLVISLWSPTVSLNNLSKRSNDSLSIPALVLSDCNGT